MIHVNVTPLQPLAIEDLHRGILGVLQAKMQAADAGQQLHQLALDNETRDPMLWATADYTEPTTTSTEKEMKYLFSIGNTSFVFHEVNGHFHVGRVWQGPGNLHIAEFLHTAWESGAEHVAVSSPEAYLRINVRGFDNGPFPYIYIEATKSRRPAQVSITAELLQGSTYTEDCSGGYRLMPEPAPGWPHKPWPIGAAILDIGRDWTDGLERRVRLVHWPESGSRPRMELAEEPDKEVKTDFDQGHDTSYEQSQDDFAYEKFMDENEKWAFWANELAKDAPSDFDHDRRFAEESDLERAFCFELEAENNRIDVEDEEPCWFER